MECLIVSYRSHRYKDTRSFQEVPTRGDLQLLGPQKYGKGQVPASQCLNMLTLINKPPFAMQQKLQEQIHT